MGYEDQIEIVILDEDDDAIQIEPYEQVPVEVVSVEWWPDSTPGGGVNRWVLNCKIKEES